jgi:hypothetical protein
MMDYRGNERQRYGRRTVALERSPPRQLRAPAPAHRSA